jgi:hypothetical protein
MAGLAWTGMRLAAHFWTAREDPAIERLLWFFVGTLALAELTLARLVLVIQDLVKLTIEVAEEGVRVDRLVRPFRAHWNEVREIGLAERSGHLTLRTARGSVTATARLLGAAPFARLVAALRARAGDAVQEWTPWAAARRQLLPLLLPALGLGVLILLGPRLWRPRLPGPGRRR